MSGVGSSELIILILIGLIVLGPKRLPQIANQIGRWIGQARRMTRAMRRQLEDELNFDDKDIKPPFLDDNSTKPEAHVPFEEDTYSPMHEDDDGEKAADAVDEEPPVEDAAEEVKDA